MHSGRISQMTNNHNTLAGEIYAGGRGIAETEAGKEMLSQDRPEETMTLYEPASEV